MTDIRLELPFKQGHTLTHCPNNRGFNAAKFWDTTLSQLEGEDG